MTWLGGGEGAGGHADELLELAREVALAAEACFQGDLCERQAGTDEPLGMLHPQTLLIGMGRHADFEAERAQEIIWTESHICG